MNRTADAVIGRDGACGQPGQRTQKVPHVGLLVKAFQLQNHLLRLIEIQLTGKSTNVPFLVLLIS